MKPLRLAVTAGCCCFSTLTVAQSIPTTALPAPDATHAMFGTTLTGTDDGALLLIGTFDQLILWNPVTDSETRRVAVPDRSFQGYVFAVSPDGGLAALSDRPWGPNGEWGEGPARNIYMVDLSDGSILWDITTGFKGAIYGATFSPDSAELMFNWGQPQQQIPLREDLGPTGTAIFTARTGVYREGPSKDIETGTGVLKGLDVGASGRRWLQPKTVCTVTDKDVTLVQSLPAPILGGRVVLLTANMGTHRPWACAVGNGSIAQYLYGSTDNLGNMQYLTRTAVLGGGFAGCSPDMSLIASATYSEMTAVRVDLDSPDGPMFQHKFTGAYAQQTTGIAVLQDKVFVLSVNDLKRWDIAPLDDLKKTSAWQVQ